MMLMIRDPHNYVSCLEQGCEAWRKGDDAEGLSWFQQACLIWLDILEQEASSREKELSDSYDELTQKLTCMMDYLEGNDTARATDVLEYDILPVLRHLEESRG